MKNAFRLLLLVIVTTLLTASISAQTKSAQTKKSEDLTIDEYFKLLTVKQLPILDKYKNRNSIVKEVDYQNQYILFAHDEWQGWGEMVLFNLKNGGGHIVAVSQYDCTKKYPTYPYLDNPRCDGTVKFFRLEGKIFKEMEGFIPAIKKLMLYGHYEKKTGRLADSDDKLIFELPRERTDIIIKLTGETVYSLKWNGKGFEGNYVN